jgi:hypothetical protein
MSDVVEKLAALRIVPVLTASDADEAEQACLALLEGGLSIVEITFAPMLRPRRFDAPPESTVSSWEPARFSRQNSSHGLWTPACASRSRRERTTRSSMPR